MKDALTYRKNIFYLFWSKQFVGRPHQCYAKVFVVSFENHSRFYQNRRGSNASYHLPVIVVHLYSESPFLKQWVFEVGAATSIANFVAFPILLQNEVI